MGRFVASVSRLVMRHRGLVLIIIGIVTLAAAPLALSVKSDFSPEDLFSGAEGQREQTAAFREHFGNTDNVMLVLVEAEDVLTVERLDYLRDLSMYLQNAEYAGEVSSVALLNLPASRFAGPDADAEGRKAMAEVAASAAAEAAASLGGIDPDTAFLRGVVRQVQKHGGPTAPIVPAEGATPETVQALKGLLERIPMLNGKLISEDRTLAVVAVMLSPAVDRVERLVEVVGDVKTRLAEHPPPPGVRVVLGGLPYLRTTLIDKMDADRDMLLAASLVVILLLLFATFRWAPAVVLPTVVVAISVGILMGGLGLLGQPLNIINNIVPVLIVVIGISDSVHLVNRYGEELTAGHGRRQAGERALRTMAVALFLTSVTTAAGFGSLVVSQLGIIRNFGITAAIGVLIAYVVTITVLPAALSLLPKPRRRIADTEHGLIERVIGAGVALVLRRRGLVLTAAVFVFIACGWFARSLDIDTVVRNQYDEKDEVFGTIQLIDQKLDGLRPVEVSLASGEAGFFARPDIVRTIDETAKWARKQPGVLSATSYADALRQAWVVASGDQSKWQAPLAKTETVAALGALLDASGHAGGGYVTPDRMRARLNVQLADMSGPATVTLVREIRAKLDAGLSGQAVEIGLAGEGYVSSTGLNVLTRDFLASIFLATIVIFGILTLMLRSVRLGLLSVPPNILPLVITLGYLGMRGISLNPATVIIFAISIGLAVDGTIHLLARFREEVGTGLEPDAAMLKAARGTGKAVVVSYVSLIVGFSVLQLSSFGPIRRFGELISVTVLGCLISTLLLLPALVSVAWRRRTRRSVTPISSIIT